MRIIVIDPFKLTVEERDIGASSEGIIGEQIHEILDGYLEFAFWIPVPGGDPDVCYVNEDGIRLFGDDHAMFMVQEWGRSTYRGCGVITGSDGQGASQPARVDIDEVRKRLMWAVPVPQPANDDEKG